MIDGIADARAVLCPIAELTGSLLLRFTLAPARLAGFADCSEGRR